MHTLSACGTSPQLSSLPFLRQFGKAGSATQWAEAFPAVLGGVNFPFAQAEIVADFVPNGIGDDALQVDGIARHLFVGTLENTDAVGAIGRRVGQTALRNRAALVEAEEIGRRAGWLHDDYQILHVGAKPARDGGDRAFHDHVEGFGCEP